MTDGKHQYVYDFNPSYDVILKKLKTYLYENELIPRDSKFQLTKYAILQLLFDYASDVMTSWTYTPEQLLNLIEYHTKMKKKFESILKKIAEKKKDLREELLDNINFFKEEDESVNEV